MEGRRRERGGRRRWRPNAGIKRGKQDEWPRTRFHGRAPFNTGRGERGWQSERKNARKRSPAEYATPFFHRNTRLRSTHSWPRLYALDQSEREILVEIFVETVHTQRERERGCWDVARVSIYSIVTNTPRIFTRCE